MRTSSRRSSGGGDGGGGGSVLPSASLYSGAGVLRGGATGVGSSFGSAFASSSSSSFSTRSPSSTSSIFDHHRSASPTRVHLVGASPPRRSPSVRFSLDRPTSPGRSLPAVVDNKIPPIAAAVAPRAPARRRCMCSPTNHPGSFRCSLHKGLSYHPHHPHPHPHPAASSPSNRLNARRSAMANSLVRIGTVEGDWVKRALAALIRPSSHQQRRRADFQPRPSRLSIMCKASEDEHS